ncbi:MFS transporter [Saccharothrix violaceirubra]|uniref:MFS family permease n=1 Tax=Saccharothrix violaceirubra TaxID=413306 RepID=A0A7W7T4A6_9PSEU|nr:MFS transporter [Saccharothrix violaceirubra]MBB4966261.1 MFS family permease [Saccharothrix violaceirubra]
MGQGLGAAFPALRERHYRVFWITGLVSNTGTAMQAVALDWYVLTITGSGTAVGWAIGLQYAPVLLFGLWGGSVVDRFPRRTVLLVAQTLYALQAATLAVLVFTGTAQLWAIYALSFLLGSVFLVENPTRLSFVSELVGRTLIPNAASLNIASLTAARLTGPAIGGLLITWVGPGWVFAVNFVSFGVVIGGLLSIATRAAPRRATISASAGVTYVLGRPGLVGVLAAFGVVATFGLNFPITLTMFAGEEFGLGAWGLGVMSTAMAVGMVAGTVTVGRRVFPSVRTVMVAAVAFGVLECVAAVMPVYPAFLVVLAATGFAVMSLNTFVSAYVQLDVTEAVRSRVMAIYTVISMGGTPIGGPIIGWVSEHAGVRVGMAAGGVVSIAFGLGAALWFARRGGLAVMPSPTSRAVST